MKLESVILADAVSTPPEGKFYVLGGGITKLNPLHLPSPIPLAILVRFTLDEDEELMEHRLQICFVDPDGGDVLLGHAEIPIIPPPESEMAKWAEHEQRTISASIALNGVPIKQEGLHRLQLYLDGEQLYDLPLPVIPVEPTPQQAALLREMRQRPS